MEMVRTKTLVKNAIILVDAAPFRQWYLKHYGIDLGKKKIGEEAEPVTFTQEELDKQAVNAAELKNQKADPLLMDQFNSGRLLACIASRPGQVGRADGYILEGEELAFYKKKLEKKKSK
jgi:small subunit ribosomal protein S8e